MRADYGIGSWPARRARIAGDRIALRQDERTRSYAQLADRVQRLSRHLAAQGVSAGNRVAYLGANDIATFEVFFATARLGAIFVPLNTRLTAPEIEYLASDAAPRVLFHAGEFAPLLAGVSGPALIDIGSLDARIADVTSTDPTDALPDVSLGDDAVILYTSGTTGRPKGAVLTHANLTFNTMNQLAHVDVLADDVALCMSPLFHATGLGQVSLPTIFKGGTVVVMPKFDAGPVLREIERLGITSFSAVPTMLQLLYDHPNFESTDLSSLRYAIYGGSMVTHRVAHGWQGRGVQVLQGYGMTEASPGVCLATPDGAAERPMSMGVPHFFTDVRIDAASTEGPGELLVRGLNVFRGYWQREADTAAVLTDGWYRSGDIVRTDPDGWSYVVDRVKDMIISGGENIYPSEVEEAMRTLPGVVDCAVVAVDDEQWGEVGSAFVIVDPDADWTATGLRDALGGRLARYKVPKYVAFVADLPRTATGKVQRAQLRAQLRAQVRAQLPPG